MTKIIVTFVTSASLMLAVACGGKAESPTIDHSRAPVVGIETIATITAPSFTESTGCDKTAFNAGECVPGNPTAAPTVATAPAVNAEVPAAVTTPVLVEAPTNVPAAPPAPTNTAIPFVPVSTPIVPVVPVVPTVAPVHNWQLQATCISGGSGSGQGFQHFISPTGHQTFTFETVSETGGFHSVIISGSFVAPSVYSGNIQVWANGLAAGMIVTLNAETFEGGGGPVLAETMIQCPPPAPTNTPVASPTNTSPVPLWNWNLQATCAPRDDGSPDITDATISGSFDTGPDPDVVYTVTVSSYTDGHGWDFTVIHSAQGHETFTLQAHIGKTYSVRVDVGEIGTYVPIVTC